MISTVQHDSFTSLQLEQHLYNQYIHNQDIRQKRMNKLLQSVHLQYNIYTVEVLAKKYIYTVEVDVPLRCSPCLLYE